MAARCESSFTPEIPCERCSCAICYKSCAREVALREFDVRSNDGRVWPVTDMPVSHSTPTRPHGSFPHLCRLSPQCVPAGRCASRPAAASRVPAAPSCSAAATAPRRRSARRAPAVRRLQARAPPDEHSARVSTQCDGNRLSTHYYCGRSEYSPW